MENTTPNNSGHSKGTPWQGSRHSLDMDEQRADRNPGDVTANPATPEPAMDEADAGLIWPGATTTGGAAAQPPGRGQGTGFGRPVDKDRYPG